MRPDISATPSVWVVVVTHNSQSQLSDFLTSLGMEHHRDAVKVVVVDSGSSDLTYVEASQADLRLATENYGYGTSINCAALATKSDWLLIMNPDARITRAQIQSLVDVAARDRVDILAPRLSDSTGDTGGHFASLPTPPWRHREIVASSADSHAETRDVASVQGSIMLIRRTTFELLGGFDEGYFLYFEEVDLCWRARQAGYSVRLTDQAVGRHAGEGSSEGISSSWREVERLRGKVRYIAKRYSRTEAAVLGVLWAAGILYQSSDRRRVAQQMLADPRAGLPWPPNASML